jgi:Fe2+ transport system protein B
MRTLTTTMNEIRALAIGLLEWDKLQKKNPRKAAIIAIDIATMRRRYGLGVPGVEMTTKTAQDLCEKIITAYDAEQEAEDKAVEKAQQAALRKLLAMRDAEAQRRARLAALASTDDDDDDDEDDKDG